MFYVVHEPFTLSNGKTFNRGDVLRGNDATLYAQAAAGDAVLANKATAVDSDPQA